MWMFPLAAAIISGVFAAQVLRRWAQGRRPHLAAWGIALGLFAVASGAAGGGMAFGWTTGWFRTYYLFGAIVNVPVLALGTVFLLAPPSVARASATAVVLAVIYACVVVVGADLDVDALATSGIPPGSEVATGPMRLLSRIYSYVGFVVVAGGAVWSAVRLARRDLPDLRRLARANALIALGTIAVAVASGFARYGRGAPFAVGLALGVAIMFAGFLQTRPRLDSEQSDAQLR